MNEEQERSRGVIAQRILEEQIYKESWERYEQVLIGEMVKVETTDERGTHLRHCLVGSRKARQQLEQIMLTGKMAEEQAARKRKVKDA